MKTVLFALIAIILSNPAYAGPIYGAPGGPYPVCRLVTICSGGQCQTVTVCE